jgi:hypothetical protein
MAGLSNFIFSGKIKRRIEDYGSVWMAKRQRAGKREGDFFLADRRRKGENL